MIPDYQTLMRPVLESALTEPRNISDVVEDMAIHFDLTYDERAHMLPSGKQTTIANRTHWARSYLKQAGLVRNIRRGWFELTERGREIALDKDIEVNSKFLEQFDDFQDFRNRTRDTANDIVDTELNTLETETTPDESLQAAHKRLNIALAANLLEATRNATPAFFEQLIVELFIAMGYGGTSEEAGRALGQSGDNGVDGVIDQDPLGVDQIYLQAKRYAATNKVGAGDIRDFFGALNIKKAQKGIFVTTSSFTADAVQTAKDLGSRIVLIDGAHLSTLMIRYNIGCRNKQVLHIKEIDEGYFEEAE